MGGGGSKCPPIFICEIIEKVIRLCTVLKKKSLSGSFKDRTIFHVSQLSYDGGPYVPPPKVFLFFY